MSSYFLVLQITYQIITYCHICVIAKLRSHAKNITPLETVGAERFELSTS